MKFNDLYNKIIQAAERYADNAFQNQVTDKSRPDFGGLFYSEYGVALPDHSSTAEFIPVIGFLYYEKTSKFYHSSDLRQRLFDALDYMKRCTREDGLIDLRFNNYDSPPDTAFAITPIGYLAYAAKQMDDTELYTALMEFLVPSAVAVAKGGFHTPNHRWVICAALALIMALEPEKCDFSDVLDSYLKEGIDINSDGLFTERSLGVYDQILSKKMLILSECCKSKLYSAEDFLEIVDVNLKNRLDFTDFDNIVDTDISGRQDYGKKYELGNAAAFIYMSIEKQNGEYAAAAEIAVDSMRPGTNQGYGELSTCLYFFFKHQHWREAELEPAPIRTHVERFMQESQLYRVKEGKLSATVKCDNPAFLKLNYGEVKMPRVSLVMDYFNAIYKAASIEKTDFGIRVYMKSEHNVKQHPAFWMPLGETVAINELLGFRDVERRELNKRPEFDVWIDIYKAENGFDLHVKTDKGLDGVQFSMDFFFEPGGSIEMEHCSFRACKDETMFLKKDDAIYVKGNDSIKICGGFYAHKMITPMHSETNGLFRIMLTDFTPVDRVIQLRCGKFSGADGKCYSEKMMKK